MSGKESLLGKILLIFITVTLPYVIIALSSRIAFGEWFIEWQYSLKSFPEDKYGMSREERKKLAKLGLKAVLSDEGMEEFKKATLSNGRKAFTSKEIKHMEDVKNLLSILFPIAYVLFFLIVLALLYLGVSDQKRLAESIIFGGGACLGVLLFAGFLSLLDYELAFEKFHDLFFDPYSWRFQLSDTLIRVYPKVFWFNGTLFVIGISIVTSFLFILVGFFVKRRYS